MYKDVWKHIFRVSKPYRTAIILSLITITIGLSLDLFKQVFLERIIDSLIEGVDPTRLIIYFAITAVGVTVSYRIFDLFLIESQRKTVRDLYNYSYNHLTKHSYTFFSNTFGGSLVSKIKRFANSFIDLQDSYLFNVHSATVKIIIISIILLPRNNLIGIIFIIWSILYCLASYLLTKRQRHYDEIEATNETKVTAILADIITNILTLKMFATAGKERNSYEKTTYEHGEARGDAWHYAWRIWAIQGGLFVVLEVATLILSYQSLQNETMSIGTLVLIQTMLIDLFRTLWNFGRGIQKMSKSLSNMKEMVDIIDQPLGVKDTENPIPCEITRGEIVFENVFFKYDKKHILKSFNLHIKSGEKIGLVGVSGSGKSTITKLLLRFIDLNSGTIQIDNQDISKLRQDDLRNSITYVPQDPLLFHRTLKENISYSKKSSLAQVISAAKKAHAHEFIKEFPEQYNTLVGERGIKLSGGERQRVAIARAIIKDAPIFIMDEATSSLDTLSEKHIQKATEKLIENKTAIIIAHRLSTVKKMDRIIVLSKGKIVEEGKHSQLLKKKGTYYNLYKHQSM